MVALRAWAWIGVLAGLPAVAVAQDLPPDLRGTYGVGGRCAAQPRIIVDAAGVHLDTAAGRRDSLPISVSFTWIGGARYDGIQIWALVKYGGKDRYGDDRVPVVLTFNAGEKPGALTAERTGAGNEPPARLDGPLSAIVQAGRFARCAAAGAAAGGGAGAPAPAPARAVAPGGAAAPAAARSPAAAFAATVVALMQPAAAPQNSFYDWRFIEQAGQVRWAPLPPDMLDKPLSDGHFFRRNGVMALGGGATMRVMAAGARTMVMNHYFRNDGPALGEQAALAALRAAGLTVTEARCPINRALMAPSWYRLSGAGRRDATLWIAEPRGAAFPYEGFNLSLDPTLKPLNAREAMIYKDRCP